MIIDNLKLLAEFRHLLDNAFIQILVWVVLFDILTGMVKGLKGKKGNSTKGLFGLITLLGLQPYANAFVLFYIASYAISITENLGQMGVPIPSFVKDRIEKLRDLTDKGDVEK